VTPFDEKGNVGMAGVAKLLAHFEAGGCKGAVLAGTNGEGPSLSAPEKRDLIRDAMPLRGRLELVLGIATSSYDEAIWLCKQAALVEAAAVLLMPPSYFRDVTDDGLEKWFVRVLDASPSPVLIYNFPQRTGVTLSPDLMERLARHDRMVGLKDSSGNRDNLGDYARAAGGSGKRMFVGDETLLWEALEAGWTGTISGAANVLSRWLSALVRDYHEGRKESAQAKFQLALPCIEALRKSPQPSTNKALLNKRSILPTPNVRAPLGVADPAAVEALEAQLRQALG
ncbi:MAG TPA: dihydrodipicolinate synthase family protein, partial [Fimbriimonadaceae bacterium]|nr:dihydrodipicolinate synthase family protein [Fimbriimonadaceae bacterium]